MRAGKAYISSLGTTGVLIASSLLLLAVVGAMLAFDRWPDNAVAETDVVAITAEGLTSERTAQAHERTSTSSADRRAGSAGDRGRAADTDVPRGAARAASVQVAAGSDSVVKTPPPADPVITELPAPDSGENSGPVSAPAPSPPGPDAPDTPTQPELPTPDELLPDPNDEDVGLSAVTAPLAESVSPVSPALSHTVRHAGDGLDGTLSGLVEATSGGTEH